MTPAARQILNALETAGERGCTKGELADAGGWGWLRSVHELRCAGHDIQEQADLWYLEPVSTDTREAGLSRAQRTQAGVSGSVEAGVGRDDSQPVVPSGQGVSGVSPVAVVSPSAEPTLFTPQAPSAIDGDVAA